MALKDWKKAIDYSANRDVVATWRKYDGLYSMKINLRHAWGKWSFELNGVTQDSKRTKPAIMKAIRAYMRSH